MASRCSRGATCFVPVVQAMGWRHAGTAITRSVLTSFTTTSSSILAMSGMASRASSGKRCLTNVSHGFHTLVVDEAAQATELSLLVPLFHGVKHCVLVGDPQQLPSTVLSKAAVQSHYDKSFFERFIFSKRN